MEECEALCTRLTIMVAGEMKCLGSQQHLKEKFGNGYSVILKIAENRDPLLLKSFMSESFLDCQLQQEQFGLLNFTIGKQNNLLSRMFGTIERNKMKLGIEDYSISQTSLEQLFLFISGKYQ